MYYDSEIFIFIFVFTSTNLHPILRTNYYYDLFKHNLCAKILTNFR